MNRLVYSKGKRLILSKFRLKVTQSFEFVVAARKLVWHFWRL